MFLFKKKKKYSNENMVRNIYFFRQLCFVITSKTAIKNVCNTSYNFCDTKMLSPCI